MKKLYCNGKKGFCPNYDGEKEPECWKYSCEFQDGNGSKIVENYTNFDRIKAMSVDEMAKLIEECDLGLESKICFEQCEKMTGDEYKCPYPEEERLSHCVDCVKQWLESEVQGE